MFAASTSLSKRCRLKQAMTVLTRRDKMFLFTSSSEFKSCDSNPSLTELAIKDKIFLLKLLGGGYNAHHLTPALLKCLRSRLDYVKSNATNGSVLITTAEGQNFCHGFDFRDPKYLEMVDPFKQLVKDLMSLPMPTIAAVNGYTMGAGLILAMSHDFLTIKTGMDALGMIELENKMILPDYFTALIRSKVSPGASARLALSGLTFNSSQAKEMGLEVESPRRNLEEPLDTAKNLAEELSGNGWDGKVYAETRKALYPDLSNVLGLNCAERLPSLL